MGAVDFSAVKDAAWVGLPIHSENTIFGGVDFSKGGLIGSAIIAIVPIALATIMEHIGDISAISSTVEKDFIKDPGLHRTLTGDGLATTFASLFGGPANTTYGENTGVLALSRVFNPVVIRIAAVFAIIIAKQMFGGLGQNWMNPALAGRCFLIISCAKFMNNFSSKPLGFDATTGATPLAVMKTALKAGESATANIDLMTMFVGRHAGTIGEVSAIALLFGAAYLLWKKVITWQIPVIYIATTAIFMFIFGEHNMTYVLAQILGGGLIFGAFFMATDYVSTPITPKGQVIYAIVIGCLTGLFRIFGSGAEGVSYSIIIGNMLSPLIESATIPVAFGKERKKK